MLTKKVTDFRDSFMTFISCSRYQKLVYHRVYKESRPFEIHIRHNSTDHCINLTARINKYVKGSPFLTHPVFLPFSKHVPKPIYLATPPSFRFQSLLIKSYLGISTSELSTGCIKKNATTQYSKIFTLFSSTIDSLFGCELHMTISSSIVQF